MYDSPVFRILAILFLSIVMSSDLKYFTIAMILGNSRVSPVSTAFIVTGLLNLALEASLKNRVFFSEIKLASSTRLKLA